MTYEEYLDAMNNPPCLTCGSSSISCCCEELTGIEEHERDSQYQGDARRCPIHPHIKTSSDDGMFDTLCGECEWAGEMLSRGLDPDNPPAVAASTAPTPSKEEDDILF